MKSESEIFAQFQRQGWIRLTCALHRRMFPNRFVRISNIRSQSMPGNGQKRALMSYIVHPFTMPLHSPAIYHHINIWRAREMAAILNRLGYVVDVVDYRDTQFVPRKPYTLFIGHGGINYNIISSHLSPSTLRIYYSTGAYWQFHNDQELKRVAHLNSRRGTQLCPDRLIEHPEEDALMAAHAIIGNGNEFTRNTYQKFSSVTMLNGCCLPDSHSGTDRWQTDQWHFLFFAGSGNIHKGLDLLLEAFADLPPHIHLWISSAIDPQFANAYAHELSNVSNIHNLGWVPCRSSEFYQLMDRCQFVILPSCSEGQPHSVIQCMFHGLIPVVTPQCGLDIHDFGQLLAPCTVEGIQETIHHLITRPRTQLQSMSRKTRDHTLAYFSIDTFRKNMTNTLKSLL